VYDFDKDTVSLGVNMHSKDKVTMYKPGERDTVKKQEAPKQSLAATSTDTTDVDENFVQVSKGKTS
jgi:hypothetical protein